MIVTKAVTLIASADDAVVVGTEPTRTIICQHNDHITSFLDLVSGVIKTTLDLVDFVVQVVQCTLHTREETLDRGFDYLERWFKVWGMVMHACMFLAVLRNRTLPLPLGRLLLLADPRLAELECLLGSRGADST